MIPSLFITGPATNAGKTFITRALARLARAHHQHPAALKPLETGAEPDPLDALALARACARPELARAPGLFRAALPLAPYAACLEAGAIPPEPAMLAARVRELGAGADPLLVEGAGGLLVPLGPSSSIADLAVLLGLPLLIVAPDQLGVLSSVLTCVEAAHSRELRIAAVVLTDHGNSSADPSTRTNHRILQQRLRMPVLRFPRCDDDDDALARAAECCGLLALAT